jgi:phage-related holin
MDGFFVSLQAFFVMLWQQWEVKALLSQILLNFIVAVAVSVRTHDFQLAKFGEFLYKKVLPVLAVYAVARVAGDGLGIAGLAETTWGILAVTLLGDLTDNLAKLGITLPDTLKKQP